LRIFSCVTLFVKQPLCKIASLKLFSASIYGYRTLIRICVAHQATAQNDLVRAADEMFSFICLSSATRCLLVCEISFFHPLLNLCSIHPSLQHFTVSWPAPNEGCCALTKYKRTKIIFLHHTKQLTGHNFPEYPNFHYETSLISSLIQNVTYSMFTI